MENIVKYSLKIKINEIDKNEFEYVAQYDQFPTIIGVGQTPEEALKEAQIFLKQYLDYCKYEGINLKEVESNDWKNEYNGKITIRLPKSLHRDLSNYAEEDGMSINSVVNDAIRTYLLEQSMMSLKEEVIQKISDRISEIRTEQFEMPRNDYSFSAKMYLI